MPARQRFTYVCGGPCKLSAPFLKISRATIAQITAPSTDQPQSLTSAIVNLSGNLPFLLGHEMVLSLVWVLSSLPGGQNTLPHLAWWITFKGGSICMSTVPRLRLLLLTWLGVGMWSRHTRERDQLMVVNRESRTKSRLKFRVPVTLPEAFLWLCVQHPHERT